MYKSEDGEIFNDPFDDSSTIEDVNVDSNHKFCAHCGKKILKAAEICPHCGCRCEPQSLDKSESSTLSILALVFAFISPIVGIVLGAIGMNSYKNVEYRNRSKTALIISVVWIALIVLIYVIALSIALS